MSEPLTRRVVWITMVLAALPIVPIAWYQVDRSDPLVYQGGWFEEVPTVKGEHGRVIEEAAPGAQVVLVLKIRWPRTNCSTEIQRAFVGSDKVVYKVPRAANEPARLGPPPKAALASDGTVFSRRTVTLPADLPDGWATHSPTVWERCTSPALKWGDYLTDIWPISIGPENADIRIRIAR